jgi:hypothetical protein
VKPAKEFLKKGTYLKTGFEVFNKVGLKYKSYEWNSKTENAMIFAFVARQLANTIHTESHIEKEFSDFSKRMIDEIVDRCEALPLKFKKFDDWLRSKESWKTFKKVDYGENIIKQLDGKMPLAGAYMARVKSGEVYSSTEDKMTEDWEGF